MFNTKNFNGSKFNVGSTSKNDSTTAVAEGICLATARAVTKQSAMVTSIDFIMEATVDTTRQFKARANEIVLEMETSARPTLKTRCEAEAIFELTADGVTFSAFGLETLKLLNINLSPGDELRIDTENMTVEINGRNSIKYLSSDSDFFNLEPGDNIITYTDNGETRSVDMRVLWKDRWL